MLQDWIHSLGEGAGARLCRALGAVLSFVVLASLAQLASYRGVVTVEGMETAQLARNLAAGKGYVTQSIRPLDLFLLNRADLGQDRTRLRQGVPDLTYPPAYPVVLAGLMRVLPFNFNAGENWRYEPELWISIFNQTLFFLSAWLLFRIASRLFDARTAWLSAIVFCGADLFWQFSLSGTSTLFLETIFLALVSSLLALERRSRAVDAPFDFSSLALAIAAGLLLGLGALTRYSFGWMLLPALLYCSTALAHRRAASIAALLVAFLVVLVPWTARNYSLSGNFFGTAGYAAIQETPIFSGDRLERELNPDPDFHRVRVRDIGNKLVVNCREIMLTELPGLAGSWLGAFFVVSLLIPYRQPAVTMMRGFVVSSLVVLFIAEALGRTHLTADSPQINAENLLILLAPVAFAFGSNLFYALLDQIDYMTANLRTTAAAAFVLIVCLPFLIGLLRPVPQQNISPYTPAHIQFTAKWMDTNELMMSDIPWAVAWYGDRSCSWLTLNDTGDFYDLNGLKPVRAIFLTQRTSERPMLSLATQTNTWGRFYWDAVAHGEAPEGFPLKKAPAGLLPDQMFITDRARWQ